jgi:branched-chain amino acid transport system substrate-binding protein
MWRVADRVPESPRGGLYRRRLIAAAGGAMLPAALRAQDAPPPLVIGVLTDQTGIGASVSGPPLLQAVMQAVQDTGALPYGRPLSVMHDSYQLKPADALAVARRWFDEGVSVIVDVPGSAAAAAVQALARSRGRTFLATGSVNPDLTGRLCSPLGSGWAIDSVSMSTALAGTMARSGKKTWFLVVPDSVLGQSLQADATRSIEAAGGQVVGRSRHPAEVADFASIVTQARNSGARAIGLCDVARELSDQIGQFQDGGLFGDGREVVAFLSAIADIHAAGAKAARGLLLACPFYWNQNDQARSFANRFFVATGQMPDAAHATAYVAIRHYLRAAIVLDSLDADRINQEMRGSPVYFFGRSAKLRIDGRLAVDLSLLRVKSPEAMRHDWDHYEQIGMIQTADIYRPLNQTGCTLGL